MRILVVTSQPPYPPHQGAAARNLNIIRHLAATHEVSLLTLVPTGHDWTDHGPLSALCASVTAVPIPPHSALKRVAGIFSSTLPDLALRHRSRAVQDAFLRLHKKNAPLIEPKLANLEKIWGAVGTNVDAVFVCGTDFGTQTSAFCSVATLRELYAPYYKAVNDWIHAHTPWKTFKHSCGSVERFYESFIEAGFDIINPVQCSAAGMDPEMLKRKYGSRLVFWGGGVDTQRVLPFGSAAEVREQVLQRCEIFAPGGGFVFNTIHNVLPEVPPENIVAMFEAVREFNGA